MADLNGIEGFQATVREHYAHHGRSFPWRTDTSPWMVYLSEVMLQQTQTSRVAALLPPFLARFPNPRAMAASSPGTVIAAWQGLGYNSRALRLHQSSIIMVKDFEGLVPADHDALLSLPGIGPNTAASIQVYAWNIPRAFVETNIRTVYIHHFFPEAGQNGSGSVSDRDLQILVEATMDTSDPRTWFWALMDYGVHLKKTVGNLSRHAKVYKPQSSFEGSPRQARGAILRVLARGALAAQDLRAALASIEAERYEKALRSLSAEGLVVCEESGIYRLP